MLKEMNRGFVFRPSGWLGAPRCSPATEPSSAEYDGPRVTRSCRVGLGLGEGGSAEGLGTGG